jgi:hypothetical protein
MNAWIEPSKTPPPKDDIFLANIGIPYAVTCGYNEVQKQFFYADIQIDLYKGKFKDAYFQTEYIDESKIISWMHLPEQE